MGKKRTNLLVYSQEVFTTAHDQFMLDQETYGVTLEPKALYKTMAELDNLILKADKARKEFHFRQLEELTFQIGTLALAISTAASKRNELVA
jgi:hypothetical protein